MNVGAVLFDRDGTLIEDVPYNADAEKVVPRAFAVAAVTAVRQSRVKTGVVTNQSGIGRGLLSHRQVACVNRRVDVLFGPFDVWEVCPHHPEDGCGCRKPAPGLVLRASAHLGLVAERVVVVGDRAADLGAAKAAGAVAILLPSSSTESGGEEGADLVLSGLDDLAACLSTLREWRR
jgi:D-glycero-D-manno-heptose 1,7-bisphosphate phosphatase